MDNMETAKAVAVLIALGIVLTMAYQLAMLLHVVFVPNWPFWGCWVVGTGATLAVMWFIVTGAGHIFFEGLVIWMICGSLMASSAFLIVDSHEEHLKRVQLKHLLQRRLRIEQQRLLQQGNHVNSREPRHSHQEQAH